MRYFKATRPDGTDFYSGEIDYGRALETGKVVERPYPGKLVPGRPDTYLSVATVPTDCTGMEWPCRLFAVVPVGQVRKVDDLPNMRAVRGLRVVAELPAHEVFGPQGEQVVALVERAGRPTEAEARNLAAAWDAALDGSAAWAAARDAVGAAAWAAAWDAALALVVQDLVDPDTFDLYGPWAGVIGDADG